MIKQGEIYWTDAEVIGGRRPAIVLTRTSVLASLNAVIVGPITRTRRNIPTEVEVGREFGLEYDSVISLDNIAVVHVNRMRTYVGAVDAETMYAVFEALHLVFEMPF